MLVGLMRSPAQLQKVVAIDLSTHKHFPTGTLGKEIVPRRESAAADEEDARTIRTGLARRVVHPRVGARAQSIDGVTSLAHVSGPFVSLPENFDHFLTENFDRVRTMASLPIKRHVTGWDTVHGLKPRFNV